MDKTNCNMEHHKWQRITSEELHESDRGRGETIQREFVSERKKLFQAREETSWLSQTQLTTYRKESRNTMRWRDCSKRNSSASHAAT